MQSKIFTLTVNKLQSGEGSAFFFTERLVLTREENSCGRSEMRKQSVTLPGVEEKWHWVQSIAVICHIYTLLMCQSVRSQPSPQPQQWERHREMAFVFYKESPRLGTGFTFAYVLYFFYMLRQSSRTRREHFINERAWFYLSGHKLRWNRGSFELLWTSAAYNFNEKLGHFPVFLFTNSVPAVLHTLKKNLPVKVMHL